MFHGEPETGMVTGTDLRGSTTSPGFGYGDSYRPAVVYRSDPEECDLRNGVHSVGTWQVDLGYAKVFPRGPQPVWCLTGRPFIPIGGSTPLGRLGYGRMFIT